MTSPLKHKFPPRFHVDWLRAASVDFCRPITAEQPPPKPRPPPRRQRGSLRGVRPTSGAVCGCTQARLPAALTCLPGAPKPAHPEEGREAGGEAGRAVPPSSSETPMMLKHVGEPLQRPRSQLLHQILHLRIQHPLLGEVSSARTMRREARLAPAPAPASAPRGPGPGIRVWVWLRFWLCLAHRRAASGCEQADNRLFVSANVS